MIKIIESLESKGMPVVWQFYTAILATGTFVILFINDERSLYTLILITHSLGFLGVYKAHHSHRQKSFPRLILSTGVGLVIIGEIIQSPIIIHAPIYNIIAFLIEQLGLALITIFAYLHMMMFEEKFNIKGLLIDYTLLIISCLFFFLIVSPNILTTLVYELNFQQQFLFLNLLIGLILLSMSTLHYLLTRSIGLTDSLRILLTVLLVIHFGLDILLSLDKITDVIFINKLSLSSFNLAGTLIILFIFIENLSLNYSMITPTRIGNQFMWISSIIAIIAIPFGLVIRSLLDAPHLDLFLIGISSIFLSIFVIWRFITLIKNTNQQRNKLKSLIQTNSLTGLSNYQGYLEKLTLSRIKSGLVIHINIDDFKAINDLYGRKAGDEVLKSLAKRLQQLPDNLFVAHMHSDLFLVVFQTKQSNTHSLIKKIQENLGIWDIIQDKKIAVPLTYGASYFKKAIKPERLAKQAEQALKSARDQHSSFSLFTQESNDKCLPRHELRHILQHAVDSKYLPIHFQPIYNLDDGSLKALELLIRVYSKEHGLLLPRQFLDQAKSYGLLTSLTQVCVKMVAKHYATLPDVIININLPPYMLKSSKILNNFIRLFEEEGLPTHKFCIEITEDEDIPSQALKPAVQKLKSYGFTIAMDDFGTGYSSLDRLSVLSVDTVKIDRSILLTAASGNTAILEWSISLTKRLGISAVVEGVETFEQLSLVKLLGADSVQGFLYSRPVSALQAINIPLNSSNISLPR